MRVLAKKMKSFGILRVQMIVGAIVMVAVLLLLPVSIIVSDPSLLLNPYIIIVLLAGMLMFGSFAYFLFIRPYKIYNNSPDVLAETDGEFLYIHGKKEAKIPLSELTEVNAYVHLPFVYSSEFFGALLVHLASENYGDLSLDIEGFGSFKLRFVANVNATSNEIISFVSKAMNGEE